VISRWPRVRRTDLSRRNALGLAGILAAAGTGYAALAGLARVARLPGGARRSTGSYQIGSGDPDAMPVTQWLFDRVPVLDPATFALRISGPTGHRTVDYGQLAAGSDQVRAVLDCTGGWYASQVWQGVRLDRLLPDLRGDQYLDVVSVTGYRRRLPASEAAHLWLAATMAGSALSPGHGGPVRLVAPGRRGFWWVKWVVRIEVGLGPDWWQPPFPTQ
jgi:DMSO/TMAO reductase YedYZ molybdopterin-dependent catalytic subunit